MEARRWDHWIGESAKQTKNHKPSTNLHYTLLPREAGGCSAVGFEGQFLLKRLHRLEWARKLNYFLITGNLIENSLARCYIFKYPGKKKIVSLRSSVLDFSEVINLSGFPSPLYEGRGTDNVRIIWETS